MSPLTWILLGAGTLVVGLGVYDAVKSPAASPATVAGGSGLPPITFLAGYNYTVTVTLGNPVTGLSTQGSVQTALGQNLIVGPDITATPTTISYTVDAVVGQSVPQSKLAMAAAAPAGSLVTAVPNGLSGQTSAGSGGPPPVAVKQRALTGSDNGTTVPVPVGSTFTLTLSPVQWSTGNWHGGLGYTLSSPAVAEGPAPVTTDASGNQINTFTAAQAGTAVISMPAGTFSVTIVVS